MVEAKAAINDLHRIMPGYSVHDWATAGFSDAPQFLVEYQRIIEGLRKGGLQENG